ncbi:hypothetical protein H5410_060667 [Solanum commersonii]|uniref:DUF4371 domain-containing protein n=1 Tax=Solanum commersonii TaxID=4109 RepID=A0A9J5W5P2_SOLCO|nr:hypothetical protein H5410_060667 [Solanum commersonii]
MTSHKIQKDIVTACKLETIKAIMEDLNGDYFSLLVDESCDISQRALRVERFIGIIHVHDTSALCLKEAIVNYLATFFEFIFYTGQCYDGASNMQGRLSGLKWEVLLNVWMNFENLKQKVQVALDMGEVESGRIESRTWSARVANTLGSHYKSFKNFISMFGSIIDVLDTIVVDSQSVEEKAKAT